MRLNSFLTSVIILMISFSCSGENANTDNHSIIDSLETETPLLSEPTRDHSITFTVDSVEIAPALLKTDSIKLVLENKLGRELMYFPEEQQDLQLVSARGNGLIQTIQECYDNHRPLTLSPDVIWLTICQGVSKHVNENFEELEAVIFKANRPKSLIARNDSLANQPEEWANLVADIAQQTNAYTEEDANSFFVPEFSTTNSVATTAYQVTLLETFRKAFAYVGESGCGIPSITLKGTRADWALIHQKLDQLDGFGMTNWKENLKPIIEEFIAVFDGKINTPFWKDIFKNAQEYNGFYVSGWIIKLFPYINGLKNTDFEAGYDEENGGYRAEKGYRPNPFLDGNKYLRSTLSTSAFPSGISEIDLKWNNYLDDEMKDLTICAGFFGIKQAEDKRLEPFITWAIYDKSSPQLEQKFKRFKPLDMAHKDDYWSPNVARKVTDSAIYDIKNFDTQHASISHIKKVLIDSILENPTTKQAAYIGLEVEMIVLTDGTLAEIKIERPQSKQIVDTVLVDYMERVLLTLPAPWFPARAHPVDVLRLIDAPEESKTIKVQAHSKVRFRL